MNSVVLSEKECECMVEFIDFAIKFIKYYGTNVSMIDELKQTYIKIGGKENNA